MDTHTHKNDLECEKYPFHDLYMNLDQQKHIYVFSSCLYVQNVFSQTGQFAVLQCFDESAQLGCSALCLDESAEELIGLLVQPFPLVLVGQVVYGLAFQSAAALPQCPPYVFPLSAHCIRKALNICCCKHSVL